MEGDFRVGEWLVQPQIGIITRGDKTVHLEPKVMEVLVYLAWHTEEVLPKERIIQAVWGDTFVTDEVLTNAISELRRAFGDDAKDPHTIQTLPRRGYRLIATVTQEGAGDSEAATPPSRQLWKQIVIVVLAAVLLLAVVLILWWSPFTEAEGPIDSIAVLPFVNTSGDEDSEYLSDGLAGTISSSLSRLSELRVLPSSALYRYRGQKVDPQTVAQELDVRAVLTGTILFRGETLAVSVELVDTLENRLLWGEQYTEEFADIFRLQEQIARQISGALSVQLTSNEYEQVRSRGTENPVAYDSFLKGLFHLKEIGMGKGGQEAVRYFRNAIAQDPSYALAYVELGKAHLTLGFHRTSSEDYQDAKEAAEEALRIDDSLAETHLLMGDILAFVDRNWSAAESSYRRAKEIDPHTDSRRMSYYLMWLARRTEALWIIERVDLRSDPLSSFQQVQIGYQYYCAKDYDRALRHATVALQQDPSSNVSRLLKVLCFQATGQGEEIFKSNFLDGWFRGFQSGGESDDWSRSLEELRKAFGSGGMVAVWQRFIETLPVQDLKPYDAAGMYASAGEKDMAFECLEKAYELPLTLPFVTDARFDSLRGDPRFEKLLRKLNLPEDAIQRHLAVPEGTQ